MCGERKSIRGTHGSRCPMPQPVSDEEVWAVTSEHTRVVLEGHGVTALCVWHPSVANTGQSTCDIRAQACATRE